jgi:hypothetical protein
MRPAVTEVELVDELLIAAAWPTRDTLVTRGGYAPPHRTAWRNAMKSNSMELRVRAAMTTTAIAGIVAVTEVVASLPGNRIGPLTTPGARCPRVH